MKPGAAFVLLLLAAVPARADDAMTVAANNFYTQSASISRGGGIPDAGARVRIGPLLTSRLNQSLAAAASAQARFMAKHKDSPPLIEGDIFSSLFEGPTAWKVVACSGDNKTARCNVSLTHQDAGQKPVSWTDTLVLANENGWKVDDVAYDANFAFGNTGTLNEMLKMAESEAQ